MLKRTYTIHTIYIQRMDKWPAVALMQRMLCTQTHTHSRCDDVRCIHLYQLLITDCEPILLHIITITLSFFPLLFINALNRILEIVLFYWFSLIFSVTIHHGMGGFFLIYFEWGNKEIVIFVQTTKQKIDSFNWSVSPCIQSMPASVRCARVCSSANISFKIHLYFDLVVFAHHLYHLNGALVFVPQPFGFQCFTANMKKKRKETKKWYV